VAKSNSPLRSNASHLLEGEGTSIIKVMAVINQIQLPLPMGEGWGEGDDLRNNMTEAEKLLWTRLRGKQILGLQFYRQKPILNFIVDFYCPAANLVIECDGSQHFTDEGLEADRVRDQALAELGLRILRFDNGMVFRKTDVVVQVIYDVITQLLEPP